MKARVTADHFPDISGGRVAVEDHSDIFTQASKHRRAAKLAKLSILLDFMAEGECLHLSLRLTKSSETASGGLFLMKAIYKYVVFK
jgi:hypothetical protein